MLKIIVIIAVFAGCFTALAILSYFCLSLRRELKSYQTQTEKLESRSRQIINSISDPIILYDPETDTIIDFNPALCDMLGYSMEEIRELQFDAIYTGEYPYTAEAARKKHDMAMTGQRQIFEWSVQTKTGASLWVEVSLKQIVLSDHPYLMFLIREISSQKKVESALRESEVKFRHLFNLSPQPISLTDLNGQIIDVNEKFCEFSRYTRNEVIGKNSLDLGFPPDARQEFIQKLTREGEVSGFEIELAAKDGEKFCIQLFSKMIDIHGQFYTLTVYYDLTAERRLEAQLIRAQKMEAVGTLAGGIAHDFNNILAAILGYVELGKLQVTENSRLAAYLDEIFKAGNRAKEVVQQILAISRQTHQKRQPIRLAQIIQDVNKLLRATLPVSIEIHEDIQAQNAVVEADPGQMHQVLMNLCTNAGQSMRESGGALTIQAIQTHLADRNPLALSAGSYIKIIVSDSGCGIMAQDRERIFDPYYTTKDKGVGTGLGLAVAKGIIEKHGGRIDFSSTPGIGTDFYVYLPMLASAADTASLSNKTAGTDLPSGSEHILFVDDEPAITDTAHQMLEYLGYSVTVHNNSGEAIADFSNRPHAFDLVITDMSMPETSGDELVQKILGIRPNLPVILCTGYNPDVNEDTAEAMGIDAFLLKPLTLKDLAVTVRKVLERRN